MVFTIALWVELHRSIDQLSVPPKVKKSRIFYGAMIATLPPALIGTAAGKGSYRDPTAN